MANAKSDIDLYVLPPPGKSWTTYYTGTEQATGFWLQTQERKLKFPKGAESLGIIKGIRVADLWADGTGGYASIHEGGVGFTHVTIIFKSQLHRGFKFNVAIMGEPAK